MKLGFILGLADIRDRVRKTKARRQALYLLFLWPDVETLHFSFFWGGPSFRDTFILHFFPDSVLSEAAAPLTFQPENINEARLRAGASECFAQPH